MRAGPGEDGEPLHLPKGLERQALIEYWQARALKARFFVHRLAKKHGKTMRTIERHFQAHFRCSPKELLQQWRLAEAKRLLAEGSAVKVVALDLGCQHTEHLSHLFKERFGVGPVEFRSAELGVCAQRAPSGSAGCTPKTAPVAPLQQCFLPALGQACRDCPARKANHGSSVRVAACRRGNPTNGSRIAAH